VRGVPFIYYGEEIGMEHYEIPLVHGLDPVAVRHRHIPQWLARRLGKLGMLLNRDECRSPMQWHGGKHAGFASELATPWLSLHPRASEVNVEAQERDPHSLLCCYRGLLALRKRCPALSSGALELLAPRELPDDVVGYRRVFHAPGGGEQAHVYLNFSAKRTWLRAPALHGARLFSDERAEISTFAGEYALSPYEGIVLFDEPSR
jgi:alpha-glucosidase